MAFETKCVCGKKSMTFHHLSEKDFPNGWKQPCCEEEAKKTLVTEIINDINHFENEIAPVADQVSNIIEDSVKKNRKGKKAKK